MKEPPGIIDISQPVSSKSACFPGDTPFQRNVTLTFGDSGIVNLTSLTMSPHVGTHADAPVHIEGDLDSGLGCVGSMSLDPFIGPVKVIDISPCQSEISKEQYLSALDKDSAAGKRILFKTCHYIRYEVFEDEYAYLSVELVESLSEKGVVLVGLDTPSVDHVRSKSLDAHHALMANGLVWLENLDLTEVVPGDYTLIALPLKLLELEASPVRAVLLKGEL